MDALQLLETLLRAEIVITKSNSRTFSDPTPVPDQVINSNRFILLTEGIINYTVESTTQRIHAPALLLVPAWVRRTWKTLPGESCHIIWCEFTANLFEPTLRSLVVKKEAAWEDEIQSFRRMAGLWQTLQKGADKPADPRSITLQIEGELKAVLARFFAEGELPGTENETDAPASPLHRAVADALGWMEENFRHEDAARQLKDRLTHTEASFRRQFKKQTGLTPAEYLHSLRMRYARYLLDSTTLSVKETAAEVGFRDPLWFSKQYHAFWGYPPSRERALSPAEREQT